LSYTLLRKNVYMQSFLMLAPTIATTSRFGSVAGVPYAIAQMNAHAVSLIAEGDAAWLSQDVLTILGRPARSFEQFAADHAAAFTPGG
jgi:hypothetical protein